MFKLCWIQLGRKRTKRYKNIEDIFAHMSHCLHSGEWIENSKGEKVEVNWENICAQNLSFW